MDSRNNGYGYGRSNQGYRSQSWSRSSPGPTVTSSYRRTVNMPVSKTYSSAVLSSGDGSMGGPEYKRSNEKEQLQGLNDRFVVYIDKVHFLEQQNQQMEAEIRALRHKNASRGQLDERYSHELHELRATLEQIHQDKAHIQLDTEHVDEDIQRLRDRFEEEARIREETEALIRVLKKDTCDSDLIKSELDKKVQSLQDEIAFIRNNHEEEVSELIAQIQESQVSVERKELQRANITDALREIRCELESHSDQNLHQVENLFMCRYAKITEAAEQNKDAIKSARDEITDYRRQLQAKTVELESVRGTRDSLERQLNDIEDRHSGDLSSLQETIHQLDNELKSTKWEMARHLREYQDLLNVKMALDIEIAAYRKLLDGEETHFNTFPYRQSTVTKATKPKLKVQHKFVEEIIEETRVEDEKADFDEALADLAQELSESQGQDGEEDEGGEDTGGEEEEEEEGGEEEEVIVAATKANVSARPPTKDEDEDEKDDDEEDEGEEDDGAEGEEEEGEGEDDEEGEDEEEGEVEETVLCAKVEHILAAKSSPEKEKEGEEEEDEGDQDEDAEADEASKDGDEKEKDEKDGEKEDDKSGKNQKSEETETLLEKKEAQKSEEEPKSESPKSESPKPSSPKSESPKPSSPKSESPKPSSPKSESPKPSSPTSESPKPISPKPESPKSETPKPTSLKTASPQSSSPKSPKPSSPKSESPKPSSPKSESPKPTSPKPSSPKSESPKPSSPKSESPKPSSPKSESPKPSSPKSESPKLGSPKSESPKPSSLKTTSPQSSSPKSESPKPSSPKSESPKPASPKSDSPKPGSPKSPESPKAESPKPTSPKSESVKEESKSETSKAPETSEKKEDAKKDVKEDSKKDSKEDVKKDSKEDVKKEDSKEDSKKEKKEEKEVEKKDAAMNGDVDQSSPEEKRVEDKDDVLANGVDESSVKDDGGQKVVITKTVETITTGEDGSKRVTKSVTVTETLKEVDEALPEKLVTTKKSEKQSTQSVKQVVEGE